MVNVCFSQLLRHGFNRQIYRNRNNHNTVYRAVLELLGFSRGAGSISLRLQHVCFNLAPVQEPGEHVIPVAAAYRSSSYMLTPSL